MDAAISSAQRCAEALAQPVAPEASAAPAAHAARMGSRAALVVYDGQGVGSHQHLQLSRETEDEETSEWMPLAVDGSGEFASLEEDWLQTREISSLG